MIRESWPLYSLRYQLCRKKLGWVVQNSIFTILAFLDLTDGDNANINLTPIFYKIYFEQPGPGI
jgi:hypothetical protein